MYRHTLQYWEELKYRRSGTDWEEEQGRVSVILSQIQTALQGMGERLEEGPTLLSYTGRMNGSLCEHYKVGGCLVSVH